jgi:hypothetical protein
MDQELLKRISSLLHLTAVEIRPCKACGIQLAMVKHNNGRLTPYTIDGVNHFINCSAAAQFRKPKEVQNATS